jgi:hypothetical protein
MEAPRINQAFNFKFWSSVATLRHARDEMGPEKAVTVS